MNTSLMNIGSFGVPLFYAIVPILFLWHLLRVFKYQTPPNGTYYIEAGSSIILAFIIACLLIIVVAFHLLLGLGDPGSELRQFIARNAFLAFFVITAVTVGCRSGARQAFAYLKFFLKVFILYGFYEFLAKNYGLPLFLDFLRNSASFVINTSVGPEGWLNTYRISSVWAEPSFSALPIGVFLYLLFFHTENTRERTTWLALAAIYSFLTVSRSVWIVFVLLVLVRLGLAMLKHLDRRYLFGMVHLMRIPLVLAVITLGASWIFFASNIFEDLSSQQRSSSIIIGLRIFADHPLFGSGMNTYGVYESLSEYRDGLRFASSTMIVHNLFVGYLQQMGIFGLFYAILPIVYLLILRGIQFEQRFFLAILFSSIGVFGGDLYYFPLTWLVLGLVAAYHYQVVQKQTKMRRDTEHHKLKPLSEGS